MWCIIGEIIGEVCVLVEVYVYVVFKVVVGFDDCFDIEFVWEDE